jgi:hypothetical protein
LKTTVFLKVRTLDEMFKKISESSENDPEQLAHTSENSPALSLSETDSGPIKSVHWQHREKCPEVIKTYNNRCANLILCKKMYHHHIHY